MKEELLSVCKHSGVVYSQQQTAQYMAEQFIDENGLCYISSGALSVFDGGETKVYTAGDIIFFRKNFLAKFKKQPLSGGSFKSITIIFDTDTLKEFSIKYAIKRNATHKMANAVTQLEGEQFLLENFFSTLAPYFETSITEHLIAIKTQEAIMLLLQQMPVCKDILFDFHQPGKIDLEAFMQQNFRFNVELKKLAFLTGRSLATFKRDFEKIFHTTPNRWLQQRRLEEAHYLLKEKSRRPSDVYHEVGFETIAHFSYSFKQFFGVNPSHVAK